MVYYYSHLYENEEFQPLFITNLRLLFFILYIFNIIWSFKYKYGAIQDNSNAGFPEYVNFIKHIPGNMSKADIS